MSARSWRRSATPASVLLIPCRTFCNWLASTAHACMRTRPTAATSDSAASLTPAVRAAYDALDAVDSIVVDPHKHGLQPYGCGCVLFRDPDVGRFYKHDSPFTYFSSAELHLGEISLECSRPGASAVALWATQQLFPLSRDGQFAAWLDQSLDAAQGFLAAPRRKRSISAADATGPRHRRVRSERRLASAASQAARRVFHAAAEQDLHLAMMEVPAEIVVAYVPAAAGRCRRRVTCLRSVLMKAEHQRLARAHHAYPRIERSSMKPA